MRILEVRGAVFGSTCPRTSRAAQPTPIPTSKKANVASNVDGKGGVEASDVQERYPDDFMKWIGRVEREITLYRCGSSGCHRLR
jgi:hypothetical protein